MLVSVTGGMSRAEGAFCKVCGAVWGKSPVRTMGGCSRVEIAKVVLISKGNRPVQAFQSYQPLLPSSAIEPLSPWAAVSNTPPREVTEPAKDSCRESWRGLVRGGESYRG